MAGGTFNIRLGNPVAVARTQDALEELEHAKPVDIIDVFDRSAANIEQRQFSTLGAFGGNLWEPLSPDYAAWKAAHYPGRPILRREGDLYQAAIHPTVTPTAQGVTLRISDPKVDYHQRGTAHMPARPVVPRDAIRRIWSKHWERYLRGKANDADRMSISRRGGMTAGGDPLAGF
jgi:hypothetical protein